MKIFFHLALQTKQKKMNQEKFFTKPVENEIKDEEPKRTRDLVFKWTDTFTMHVIKILNN